MSKLFRVFMILSIVLSSFPLPLYQAWAADLQLSDEATAMAEGLKDFSARVGGLGSFEEFQDPVFFTITGPGDENALRLDTLFWESLGDNLAASYPDLDSLLTDIDGFDGDYGGVAVAFSNVTGQTDGNLTTVSFDINAARIASLPVAYASQPVEDPDSATPGPCDDLEDNGGDGLADGEDPDCTALVLSGGGITTTLGLTASLEFQLDSNQAVPSLAFGLVGEPVVDMMVSAAGGISGFEGRFGFTDVDVTGTADLNEHIQVAFADPDGDGLITQDEWNNTENVDLVSMAFEDVPGMDDVAVSFNLDSDLIAGSADGSLSLTIPDLSNGGAQTPPEINLGEHLAKFGNVGPDEMLAGLAAYAAALDTSLFVADDPLPFLTGRYSDSFLPGDSLLDMVRQQGDALVICGPYDTLPPSGDPEEGGTIYCQAIAPVDPVEVSWSLDGTPADSGATDLTTVGVAPSTFAVFNDVPAGVRSRFQVIFKDPPGVDTEGEEHTAILRVRSAQELLAELSLIPGVLANLSYISATLSLQYEIGISADPAITPTQFAFADLLRQDTRLANLTPTGGASATLDVNDAQAASVFGTILVDNVEQITPGNIEDPDSGTPGPCDDGIDNGGDGFPDLFDLDCARPDDRFFIGVDSTPGSYEVAVGDLAVAAVVDLTGNIGFLAVDVVGNSFDISKPSADPALGVDIIATGIPISITSTTVYTIPNAIGVRQLLADPGLVDFGGNLSRDLNLQMSAELAVSSQLNPGQTLSGLVTISWPDVGTGAPLVSGDGPYREDLQPFDISPEIIGAHTTISGSVALVDDNRDFLVAFGVEVSPGDVILSELFNGTDGSSCPAFMVTDEHTLTCVSGFDEMTGDPITGTLQGGFENDWDIGDAYEIVGDPLALETVLLDNLYDMVDRMNGLGVAGGEFSQTLPLIGLSPRDLTTQFDDLAAAVVGIKKGLSAAEIVCSTTSDLPYNLQCQAFTRGPVSDVDWDISHGTIYANENLTGTVGVSPTDYVQFQVVVSPTEEIENFSISVTFTDEDDIGRLAEYPPRPPSTLQEFELALEALLSLGPDDLLFELTTLDNPNGTTARHLVTRLGIDDAGAMDFQLRLDLPPEPDADPLELSAEISATLQLDYASHMQLDVGIPLTSEISPTQVAVLESTEVWMSLSVDESDILVTATIGALEVTLGGVTVFTGTHTVPLITGTHNSPLTSTTTLTDTTRDFQALGIVVSATLTNVTKSASCLVTEVGVNTLTCAGGLGGETWEQGDEYELISPSTTRLHDPSTNFITQGIKTDGEVTNTTDGASCTITAVEEHVVTCSSGLSGGAWDGGDAYEVEGASFVYFNAGISLGVPDGDPGNEDETFSKDDFISALELSRSGPDGQDDAVAVLAVAAETVVLNAGTDEVVSSCPDGICAQPWPDGYHVFFPLIGSDVDFSASSVGPSSTTAAGLGVIEYRIADLSVLSPTVSLPAPLLAALDVEPLAWSLINVALPYLGGIVEENLDGSVWGEGLPLAGDDLSAGADVDGQVRALSFELDSLDLGGAIEAASSPDEIEGIVQDLLSQAIENVGLVLVETGGMTITVDVVCDGGSCQGADMQDVDDVEVGFTIGDNLNEDQDDPEKGCANGTCGPDVALVPFGIGLPGLPLTGEEDDVQAQTAWKMGVVFGLSRADGPYLTVDGVDELLIGSQISMTANTCDEDLPSLGDFEFTDTRCLDVVIGFLPGSVFDGDNDGTGENYDDPSYLDLLTVFDLRKGNSETGRLTFGNLLDGTQGHLVKITAEGNVDFSFSTSMADNFPGLVGTFHLTYSSDEVTLPRPSDSVPVTQLEYRNLHISIGQFFQGFVGTIVEDIQSYTKPLQPAIDIVTAPIPVISDLSEAVGQGPVSLLTILAAVSGNDLSLLERLGEFITFINNLPTDQEGLIPLGESTTEANDDESGFFGIDYKLVNKPVCGEEEKLSDKKTTQTCESSEGKKKIDRTKMNNGKEKTREISSNTSYSGAGITFPFLNDTSEIYGILMGSDATLLRIDLGTLKAEAGVSYNFGPFFVGPVPVDITIGGSIEFTGRFAMGYSTRGFRLALAGEGFGEALLDGIFIDDFDADGNEVREIVVKATIYAGAAVSIKIFRAGLEAGATFTLSLDWNDPNGDGKLYIDEINIWRWNPICLFVVTGELEFFLKLFVEIDLFLFTARAEWEPYRTRPPIKVFEVKCEPPQPLLGQVDNIDGIDVFRLNIGPYKGYRNIFEEVTKEKITVRQLTLKNAGCPPPAGPASECDTPTGTWIAATFQGINQDLFVPASHAIIYADASDGDIVADDVISLLPGADADGNDVLFTLDSRVYGGRGNDRITTGNGVDIIDAGQGNDVVNARGGDDTITAGPDDADDEDVDSVDGGVGHDIVYGGDEADVLNGGPGIDLISGGPGNDQLAGGPGLPPIPAGAYPDELQDKVDVLIGDAGDDILDGSFAGDFLFGDSLQGYGGNLQSLRDYLAYGIGSGIDVEVACQNEGATTGDDRLSSGDGLDYLFGGPGNDSLVGGKDNDRLCGHSGDDSLDGQSGDDTLEGGADGDVLYGQTGNDILHGGSGHDDLLGGDGHDILHGDSGLDILLGDEGTLAEHNPISHTYPMTDVLAWVFPTNAPSESDAGAGDDNVDCDNVSGEGQADCLYGDGDNDFIFGENGNDQVFGGDGDDYMEGNAGEDYMDGNDNSDTMHGGQHNDIMFGGLDADDDEGDFMWGDSGDDFMSGNIGNDVMRGGIGDDTMEGNEDTDTMYGDADQDDMIGGSSIAEALDANDYMYGSGGHDVMIGDNGTITRIPDGSGGWLRDNFAPGAMDVVRRVVTLFDVATTDFTPPPGTSGGDEMYGDQGFDQMWGQGDGDEMYGGEGDDILFGNDGDDWMYGGEGQDDLLGGTGRTTSDDPDTAVDGRLDGSDHIYGGDSLGGILDGDFDVIVGDNAIVDRPVDGDGAWQYNTYNGAYVRQTWFYDLEMVGSPAGAGTSDGDFLYGEASDDVMYGQGGGDYMEGGTEHDYMEGNAGTDTMFGNAGQDDMIGGTGRINDDPFEGTDERLDDFDWMYGEEDESDGTPDGDGADVMLGDNGIIDHHFTADGGWVVNTYNGSFSRRVILLDVETLSNTVVADVYGGDFMYGNDNDDILYGQGGPDEMHGGAGDDYMEGNAASDLMYGDGEADDMLGGTARTISDDPSTAQPGRVDSSTSTREVYLGTVMTATVPLGDTMYGGDGADEMLGDNGIIDRPVDNDGFWLILNYETFVGTFGDTLPRHPTGGTSSRVERSVQMLETEPGLTAGSDWMFGGDGDDNMYGQFDDSNLSPDAIGDEMWGEAGEDAMLGDNGLVQSWVIDTPTVILEPKQPFFDDDVMVENTLFRQAILSEFTVGGADRMQGGEGTDWMHGGAGDDLMNGNAGNDHVFGDDDDDAIWGGPDHDHLWGGNDADYLDVLPREEREVGHGGNAEIWPADPLEWFLWAEVDNYQDIDYIYGGWNQDAMQADVADTGPVPGDRLIDWVGAYNIYYLCPPLYGEFVITRALAPGIREFLQDLSASDGAYQTAVPGTSGFEELAFVFPNQAGQNSNPPHPDNPGHFTCPVTLTITLP